MQTRICSQLQSNAFVSLASYQSTYKTGLIIPRLVVDYYSIEKYLLVSDLVPAEMSVSLIGRPKVRSLAD